jgi:hypothetical protein
MRCWFVQLKEQNTLLLRTIQQKHERWKYDREFAKIVTKMEKGKNLKSLTKSTGSSGI